MTLTAYWWSPRRDRRALLSELRHSNLAWLRMTRYHGTLLQNFGDELSALAIREATGVRPEWAPVREASMIGIGSILELYANRGGSGYVWGSGVRSPASRVLVDPDKALAVRGTKTRDHLGLPHETPLGDPGLIARALFPRSKRRSGELVLPHFSAFAHEAGLAAIRAFAARGSRIVAPSAPVEEVCREIGRSNHLLTSSLHGLVVADALGVPATLVDFAATREPQFKYADYASVFEQNVQFTSVGELLNTGRASMHFDEAVARTDGIAGRIDGIVDGLFEAARKLT